MRVRGVATGKVGVRHYMEMGERELEREWDLGLEQAGKVGVEAEVANGKPHDSQKDNEVVVAGGAETGIKFRAWA